MIRYWYRLENLDSIFTLLKDAYKESKKIFEIKIPFWYGSITLIIKNIRGLKELSNVSKNKFKNLVNFSSAQRISIYINIFQVQSLF
jgi:hypothetical protein